MTGLQTIILNNSYYSGLRVRLDCSEHTNLQGENGAGKTTTLRLVPMFYGYEPNKLIDKAGGKSGFVEFYLPNKQSMIVFEYTRAAGETCCAVLYRRDSDVGFAYRLIKGAANDTIFHPRLEPFYKSGQDASSIMLDCMPKITGVSASSMIHRIIDYRSIIQNDPSGGGKRQGATRSGVDVQGLSAQFSLVAATSKMLHIDSLTTVSLRKDQHIARLKEMIVDSMLSNTAFVGAPPTHDKNADLWNDLRSLSAFLNSEKLIKSALDRFSQIQADRVALLSGTRRLIKLKMLGEQKTVDLRKAIAELNEQLDTKHNEHREARQAASMKAGQYQGQADQISRQIDALHQQRKRYDDEMAMPYWLTEYNNQQKIAGDLKAARSRLDLYQTGSSEITRKADDSKREIERDAKAQRATIEANRSRYGKELENLQEKLQADQNQLFETSQAETRAKTQLNNDLSESLDAALEELRHQAADAGEYSDEEKSRIATARQGVKDLRAEHIEAAKRERNLQDEYQAAIQESSKAEQNHAEANAELSGVKRERQRLSDLLFPADGSLLAFLRECGVPWQDSLGKTINPALLTRKDLAPRLAPSPAAPASLYGIELELDSLALPEQAESEAVLTEQLRRVDMQLTTTSDKLDTQARKWKQSQELVALKREAHAAASMEVAKLASLVEQADKEGEAVIAAIGLAVDERKQDFKSRISQRVTQNKAENKLAADELRQLGESHERQNTSLNQTFHMASGALKDHITKIDAQLAAIQKWVADEHSKIEDARNEQLKGQGFDVQTIQAAEKLVTELQQHLDNIHSRQNDILGYQHWMETAWPELPVLTDSLVEINERIQALQDELRRVEAKHQDVLAAITKDVKRLTADMNSLIKAVEGWAGVEKMARGVIDAIPELDEALPETRDDQPVSLEMEGVIVQGLADKASETDRLMMSVASVLVQSGNAINQNPDSHIYQKWQYLRNARLQTSSHTEGSMAYKMESMLDLRRIMDHDVPEIQKALIENVKSAGGQMARYHGELRDVSNRIKQISHILESKLNTEHDFEAFSSIEVRLASKIEEFDYWPHLKSFATEWHAWDLSRTRELPPDSLQQSLQLLDRMFKRARMNTNEIGSLVDLVINITENGRVVRVLNDSDLRNVSSTGLSSIVVMVIFAALSRYLCPDESVRIIWPIDELGELHPKNVDKLFKMMDQKNIVMLCAQPAASHEFLKRYKRCYHLSRAKGVRDFQWVKRSSASNPLRNLIEQPAIRATQQQGVDTV